MYQLPTATHQVNYWVMPIMLKKEIGALDIIDATCHAFNIVKENFLSTWRKREIVKARYICMYVMGQKVIVMGKNNKPRPINPEEIAEFFNKDRTTVIHGIDQIENDLSITAYRAETNQLINSVIELL